MEEFYVLVKECYNCDPKDSNRTFVLYANKDYNKIVNIRKKLIENVLTSGDPWFNGFKEKYDITKLVLVDNDENCHQVYLHENNFIGLNFKIVKRQVED